MRRKQYSAIETWSTGNMGQEVSGESHYTNALRKVARSLGGGAEGEGVTVAHLMPDPRNQHAARGDVLVGGDRWATFPPETRPCIHRC